MSDPAGGAPRHHAPLARDEDPVRPDPGRPRDSDPSRHLALIRGLAALCILLAIAVAFLWRELEREREVQPPAPAPAPAVEEPPRLDLVEATFAAAWLMRRDTFDLAPTTGVFMIEVGALLLGCVGGWLGGELVDRLGVGVDDGANVNAPNSITHRSTRPIESGRMP